ncbi:MAG: Dyp-type peroxidase [Stellaceae bacterium]
MTQAFVTVALPFAADRLAAVTAYLESLREPTRNLGGMLDRTSLVHFMSITALPAAGETTTQLILEISADGEPGPALERICAALSKELLRLLDLAGIAHDGTPLGKFLFLRRVDVGQGWFSTPGVNFSGTPGMTVERVTKEADLAKRVSALLDDVPRSDSALATLERVRSILWKDDAAKWAFVAEAAPLLEPAPSPYTALLPALASAIAAFLWPFLLVAALPLVAFVAAAVLRHSWTTAAVGLGAAFAGTALIVAAELGAAALAYGRLRALEQSDVPDDTPPVKERVDEIMKLESFTFQNHLASVSIMKPAALRRFTLRLGLWAAGLIARNFSQPGFLASTSMIHFARWLLLPGTDKLVFFSNYDGAWESYLENFIQQAHQGVTGIWSNTRGFPKTSNLFSEGAADGNRLRRWTRRQQYPSAFWYSAYPTLTMARIRTNAAIRQGIAVAATEPEAADWLSCFGSAPRPADEIVPQEVPTLALGGLRHLRYAKSLLLQLPADTASCKAWLSAVEPSISYGDTRQASSAVVVGFSHSGLRKLGLDDRAIATFPVAFQDGMYAPWRARAIGDDPSQWRWGGPKNQIDAIMVVYALDDSALPVLAAEHSEKARAFAVEVAEELAFAPLPKRADPVREPFGYVDGISQPALRGVGRWTEEKYRDQLIEPGEIILGYRDNSGYLPPSPMVAASDDPENLLPGRDANPQRQRPDFSVPQPTGQRDLGCNGTFLVVRQLEQDVDAFNGFLDRAARSLAQDQRMPRGLQTSPQEWIAAKMLGRWRADGSSLVRNPHRPRSETAADAGGQAPDPDNTFLFGAEDSSGQRCPFGAHIRRANPRDTSAVASQNPLAITNRHRILRVGRPYAPQGEATKPGLIFMCLNADIERQFEFLQQTWLLGPSFQGLEDETDPILRRTGTGHFTIPTPDGPLRLKGLKDFVSVKGGGYFFMPGRRAVQFLAHPTAKDGAATAASAIKAGAHPDKERVDLPAAQPTWEIVSP